MPILPSSPSQKKSMDDVDDALPLDLQSQASNSPEIGQTLGEKTKEVMRKGTDRPRPTSVSSSSLSASPTSAPNPSIGDSNKLGLGNTVALLAGALLGTAAVLSMIGVMVRCHARRVQEEYARTHDDRGQPIPVSQQQPQEKSRRCI